METVPERRQSEACDLASHVVMLRRRHPPPVTLLAALNRARTSLRREPRRDLRRAPTWLVGAVERGDQEQAVVDAAPGPATRDLRRPPSTGYAR